MPDRGRLQEQELGSFYVSQLWRKIAVRRPGLMPVLVVECLAVWPSSTVLSASAKTFMKEDGGLTVVEVDTQMPSIRQRVQADEIAFRLFHLLPLEGQLLLGECPEPPLG